MKPEDIKLVSRTHFVKTRTDDHGWQWYWATKTPDERENIGGGLEGYANLNDAVNGFMSQQGHPEWKPGQLYPTNFRMEKIDPQHYVIMRFEKDTD